MAGGKAARSPAIQTLVGRELKQVVVACFVKDTLGHAEN